MERDRELDHAQIRAEMTAGLRKHFDQLVAHFLCELRQTFLGQRFHVGRRTNSLEERRGGHRVSEEANIDILWFSFAFQAGPRQLSGRRVQILSRVVCRHCCG